MANIIQSFGLCSSCNKQMDHNKVGDVMIQLFIDISAIKPGVLIPERLFSELSFCCSWPCVQAYLDSLLSKLVDQAEEGFKILRNKKNADGSFLLVDGATQQEELIVRPKADDPLYLVFHVQRYVFGEMNKYFSSPDITFKASEAVEIFKKLIKEHKTKFIASAEREKK